MALWLTPPRRRDIRDTLLILIGATIQAVSYRLFLIPAGLPGGGVSGLAQIINHFNDWPIGLMVMAGNLPLFIIGWRYLGGQRFAYRTILAVFTFSTVIDLSTHFIPPNGLTSDLMLNALYGGVVNGIGFALVYRGRGTSGGTDILGRVVRAVGGEALHRRGPAGGEGVGGALERGEAECRG